MEFTLFISSIEALPQGDYRSPTFRPFLLGKVVHPRPLKG